MTLQEAEEENKEVRSSDLLAAIEEPLAGKKADKAGHVLQVQRIPEHFTTVKTDPHTQEHFSSPLLTSMNFNPPPP